MVSRVGDVWDVIAGLVREEGLELFDLDLPSGRAGVLRVYVASPQGDRFPISVDDCARVSRRILDFEHVEELMPGNVTLEVSSPGINRRLRRDEQFARAVGERVKVSFTGSNQEPREVTGRLVATAERALQVEDERTSEVVHIALDQVRKARVDYLFAE